VFESDRRAGANRATAGIVGDVLAYLTDVEGRWDKIETFASGNPFVSLSGDDLVLADDVTFVFGGDTIDRGPWGRRIVRMLLAARRRYGDRVILLAGNRDINKVRLAHELDTPPADCPPLATRGERLQWIFPNTMGAPKAFAHRATELAAENRPSDDESVAASYLEDIGPGGDLRAYLHEARLAYRHGVTLFVHGGVTDENIFRAPGVDIPAANVDAWIAALDVFYRAQLDELVANRVPEQLIAYQRVVPGTELNQGSVVYARPTDSRANPHLPSPATIAKLRASGIERVVVGHTPSGDCPAILRDDGFELVMADNSYGRVERGSHLAFTDELTMVGAMTELDDGRRLHVAFASKRTDERTLLGLRDATTKQLVKAQLPANAYLLFRGLPERKVEQVAGDADEIETHDFELARE